MFPITDHCIRASAVVSHREHLLTGDVWTDDPSIEFCETRSTHYQKLHELKQLCEIFKLVGENMVIDDQGLQVAKNNFISESENEVQLQLHEPWIDSVSCLLLRTSIYLNDRWYLVERLMVDTDPLITLTIIRTIYSLFPTNTCKITGITHSYVHTLNIHCLTVELEE